ncbi:MAG TPA: hypothetical protein VEJ86_14080 [Candidatus Binataceae bacterium]|nr:hypothetical protein [Candidatus Binataceae bacterium]
MKTSSGKSQQRRVLTCPQCGGHMVTRSRSRNVVERLFFKITQRRAHRCHDCDARFYDLPRPVVGAPRTPHHQAP